jgi:hypothetical protein
MTESIESQETHEMKYNLDIPSREGEKGFVGMFFEMFLKISSTVQSQEFSTEPQRAWYQMLILIGLIPEEAKRRKIKDAINNHKRLMIEEYKREGTPITEAVNNHILITSSLESLGLIAEFIDEMVGLSYENKIGWAVGKDKDIIIKNSPTDLRIKDLERKIYEKDTEIEELKRFINDKK